MPRRKNTRLETIDEVTEEIASTGSYFNEEINIFTPEVTNVDEQKDDSNESEKTEKRTS